MRHHHTVDYLSDDPRALAACSLTCHEWLPSARLHQFHTVVVEYGPRWALFQDCLEQSPGFAPYVRRLVITRVGKGPENQEAFAFFRKLTNIEDLTFKDWSTGFMSDNSVVDLRNFFPMVKTLHVCECDRPDDLYAIICSFPQLSALHVTHALLIHTRFSHPISDWARFTARETITIDTLIWAHSSLMRDNWASKGSFVLHLRKLEIAWLSNYGGGVAEHAQSLIRIAGPNLEHLAVTILDSTPPRTATYANVLDLSCAPQLISCRRSLPPTPSCGASTSASACSALGGDILHPRGPDAA